MGSNARIGIVLVMVALLIACLSGCIDSDIPAENKLTFSCNPSDLSDLHLIDGETCGSELQYQIYDLGETKVLNRIKASVIVDTKEGWDNLDRGPVSFWMTDSTDKNNFGSRLYTTELTYGELTDYDLDISDKAIGLRTGRYFVISSFGQMYVSFGEGSLYFD